MIVREVLGDAGVAKITAMVKGTPGTNPMLGDWWFAETDPAGVPLLVDGGVLLGNLAACMTCHLGRAKDDYLFGVAASQRDSH
jgi:hypothetical protein